jgi:hypothetical protein
MRETTHDGVLNLVRAGNRHLMPDLSLPDALTALPFEGPPRS